MRTVTEVDRAIGQRIRDARKMRSVPLRTVAEALVVSIQQMTKYESGQNRISAANLVTVSELLQVDLCELAGVEANPKNSEEFTVRAKALAGLFDRIQSEEMQDAIYRLVETTARPSCSDR